MDNGIRQEFISLIKGIKEDRKDDEKAACVDTLKEFLNQHLYEESPNFAQLVKGYIEDLLVKSSTSYERSAGILLVNWALRLSSGTRGFFSDSGDEESNAVVMVSDDGSNPLNLAALCKIIEPTFKEFPNKTDLLNLAADTLEEILVRISNSINLSAVTDSVEDILKSGLEMLSGMPFGSITTSAKGDSLKCLASSPAPSRNASMSGGFLGQIILSQQAQARRSAAGRSKGDLDPELCLGGVLIVRAVARAVPGVFGHYVGRFVSIVGIPLGNNALELRELTHKTLCEVLRVYGKQDAMKSKAWFDELFDTAKKTLDPKKKKKPVLVHSALLLFDALIDNMPFSIKEDHLSLIMEKLFHYQKNKDAMISNVSMSLFPKIAKISPDFFTNEAIITPTLGCIFQVITKNSDKTAAFAALGELTAALGSKLNHTQVKSITDILGTFLDNQKLLPYIDEAMECITKFAHCMKVSNLLDLFKAISRNVSTLISYGLTSSLINSLNELCKMSSSLRAELQYKMFTLITETLRKCLQAQQHSQLQSGQQQQQTTGNQQQRQQGQQSQQQRQQQQDGQNTQYVWQELLFKRPPLTRTNKGGGGGTGLPSYAGTGTGADKYSSISSIIINGIGTFSQNKRYPLLISTPEPREGDPEVAILALKTLTVFDISENDVLDFANETVVLFLENESPRVQQEAALACIALMLASSPGETGPLPVRGHAAGHIEALLLRLIDKAVSSADITTKLTILRNLSPRFDSHLVRNAVVESLFVLLGDESFEVQESALTIIGRLLRNPLMESYYPRLRNFLADLICALRFTRDVRTKLCSTMLLERLMRVAPRLGCAYADTILPALMPQLSSPNVRLNTAGMTAVGELAAAFPPNLERFHKDFMEPIMNILRDKTTTPEHVARRQATMHTLGELIKATGTAVSTMKLYPVLRRVLFKSVGTEREPSLRMELIRLIGIIGAADPYFYREIHLQETRKIVHTNNAKTSVFSLPTTPVDDKNYNTFVVISALSKILNDPSLVCCHTSALKCMQVVFHVLGSRTVDYMDMLMEPLLVYFTECGPEQRVEVVNCFVVITKSLKYLIECYAPQIAELVQQYWDESTLISNLVLMEYFAKYLNDVSKPAVELLMPHFMESLEAEVRRTPKNCEALSRFIECVEVLAPQIEEFHRLVFPLLNSLLDDSETPVDIACKYILMAGHMCASANISSSIGTIITAILRLLSREVQSPARLLNSTVESFLLFAQYNPISFAPFIPAISRVLQRYYSQSKELNKLITVLAELHLNGSVPYTPIALSLDGYNQEQDISAVKIKPMPLPKLLPDEFNGTKKLSVNTNALRNVLDISSQAHTKDDWIEWMRQYSLVLLQCSPSPQLRICYELAQEYHPLVQDLFPAAFIACWVELPDRDYLLSTLARIIESPDVPQEVTQALLDVLEFLERKERPFFAEPSPLPSSPPPQPFLRSLSPSVSGMASPIVVPSSSPSAHSPKARHQQQRAQDLTGLDGYCWPFGDPRSQMPFEKLYAASYKCRAFAKALRLKEIIYQEDPENRRHIEDLISTNNKLQLYDASRGVVVQAQKALHLELTATVYEKLREWKTALTLYEERLRNSSRSTSNSSSSNRDDLEVQLGCMRCLRALGDNKKVVEIASAALQRPGLAKQQRREIAEIGGRAGMMAESWDFVERCLRYTPEGSVTRMLFRSVLEIHAKRYDAARTYILRTREALDTEVSALLGESYERAYPAVVCAQQLSEMEQAIDYLETEDARKREIIRLSFNDKLRNTVVYEVDTWQSVLNVHALCVDRHTYPEMWVKFAGICRKQSRPALAVLVLEDLSGLPFAEIPANIARISPTISLAAAKVMWYQDKRQAEAVRFTESLCKHLVSARKGADPRITAKAFLYLGIWRYEMAKAGGTAAICDNICDISEALDTAVHYQGDWHRALHTWALFNCDLVAMCQAKEEAEERGFRMCGSCAMPISSACTSASSSYSSTPFRKLQAQRLVSPSYGGDHGYGGDGMGAGAVGSSGGVYDYYDDYGGSNSYVGDESNNNNYDYDYECEGSWNRQQGPTPWDVSEGDTDECEEGGADEGPISRKMLEKYLVVALESLVESIKLAGESTLQDMLRLVSLGFSHGHRQCAQQILTNAVRALDGSLWVQVIPQLISQMHTPTAGVQRFIAEVIGVLCEQHPQVIVYPLIVAAKSRHSARQAETARRLYEGLRVASPRVASQAEVFAKELARLSLNWYEIWFVGLDNAYRQYVEGDVRGMQKTFASLFRMYRRKAETPLEQGFVQRLDGKIYELECALQETGSGSGSNSGSSSNGGGGADIVGCMRDIYNEIERYGMGVQNASLRQCAPLLLQEDFSSLCIPGTYVPHEEPIMITAISRSVPILSSKQRPRKLQLTGSNGVRYQFLLKAREDLRQDERAMQFFGLVNTLLAAAPGTRKDHLGIVRYAVVPLSPSVGIIGWVLHSSTIYDLVQEYRRVKDIPFNMEYDLLAEFVPEYDMLTGLQKVEVMERVMEDTTGNDLKHIMWLHSANSEEWLQRRTRYARSLAVTSMSGHILGLGDRHPSNIMIDKDTGDVIHIDLGDCFEVAMHRKAYPERIPFRLTRMFINALEASGVEGSFRLTCEKVLSVLRDNKESLLTVLETFVYDPLLNWRITKAKKFEQSRAAYRPPCDCPHTDSFSATAAAAAAAASSLSLSVTASYPSSLSSVATLASCMANGLAFHLGNIIQDDDCDCDDDDDYDDNAGRDDNSYEDSDGRYGNTGRDYMDTGYNSPSSPDRPFRNDGLSDEASIRKNPLALAMMKRVTHKLNGREGKDPRTLSVSDQVEALIQAATDPENVASSFKGWAPFW